MRDKNVLAAKLWLTAHYVLKAKSVNHVTSPKNIIINAIKFAYLMGMFITKNIVNVFKKNIILNLKNMQVKNIAKNMRKYHQNAFYQLIIFI